MPGDLPYIESLRDCFRSSAHLHTLIGLMQKRGVRFLPIDGKTDHGVEWSAIVVQGRPDVDVLREVAKRIAATLDEERCRLRNEALDG